jgi:hypothetical protein
MRYESYPQITYDGLGGAVCAWFGKPWHIGAYDRVYVQRIYADGTPGGVAGEPQQQSSRRINDLKVYPNPSSDLVYIRYQIAKEKQVSLNIYNIAGQLVKTMMPGVRSPGQYEVLWNGRDEAGRKLSSGIYFVAMKAGDLSLTSKMLKLK